MKFSTKTDIEAPIAFVYAALTDFDTLERNALRRGVEVMRTSEMGKDGAGMSWHVSFQFRGRMRELDLKILNVTAPNRLELSAKSPAIDGSLIYDLVEMSSKRTRMHVTANVTPITITAKLFIQSLRLARTKVDRKFNQRIAAFGDDIEQRFQGGQIGGGPRIV